MCSSDLFLLARSSIVSELGFIVSFVWVRDIYCLLNHSCEPFLKLPAHPEFEHLVSTLELAF